MHKDSHSDMYVMASQIAVKGLSIQQLGLVNNKENLKVPCFVPL